MRSCPRFNRCKTRGRAGQDGRARKTRNEFGGSIAEMRHCAAQTVQAARLLPGSARNRYGSIAKEERMRVEILYFSGCPNYAPAVDCVREVLAQEDTQAEMVE